MLEGIIYDCPNVNCTTPIYTGECRKDCWERYNKEMGKKTMTNADHIRSMSDEELACYLIENAWDCHLCSEHFRLDNEPLLRGERCDEKCVAHCLEWLAEPYKEKEE